MSQPAVDTNRDYVAKLKARLQHNESLLQKVLNTVDVATAADVERDVYQNAVQSSALVRQPSTVRQLDECSPATSPVRQHTGGRQHNVRQLVNVCLCTTSSVRQPTVVRQSSTARQHTERRQHTVRQLDNLCSPTTSPVRQHLGRQPSTARQQHPCISMFPHSRRLYSHSILTHDFVSER